MPSSGVTFIGDSGDVIDKAFVEQLARLQPSLRRLALAVACVRPWRVDGAPAPACFEQILAVARADSGDEEKGRDRRSHADPVEVIDSIIAPFAIPIPKSILRDIAAQPPTVRRIALIHSICSVWSNVAEIPECYRREFEVASAEAQEEYLAWRGPGSGEGFSAAL